MLALIRSTTITINDNIVKNVWNVLECGVIYAHVLQFCGGFLLLPPQRLARWIEPPFKFVDLTYLLTPKMWILMSWVSFKTCDILFIFLSEMYMLLKDLLQLHITMKRSTPPRWLHTTKTQFLVLGAQTPAVLCKEGTKGFGILVLLWIVTKSGVTSLFVARQMAMIVISLSLTILYRSDISYINYHCYCGS